MTAAQRWRWWIRLTGGATALVPLGMVVALVTHSATVLALTLAVLVLVFVAVVAVRARPGALVPPPLQGLDLQQRRLVTEAVNAGRPTPRPELAEAVAAMARRRRSAMVLFLASAAIGLYLRIDSLASGAANPAFDLAFLAFWIVTGVSAVRTLARASRARAA